MYLPAAFRCEVPETIHELIRSNPFAVLVSTSDTGLEATHLPLLLDTETGVHGTLRGHVARANGQWERMLGQEALAVFSGPHAYISPAWYASQPSVPTWNYAVAHAYGHPRMVEETSLVLRYLEKLTAMFEGAGATAWSVSSAPEGFIEKLSYSIVAFEIPIARLEAKFKLGQNRSRVDREGAIAGLQTTGSSTDVALGELMRNWIE